MFFALFICAHAHTYVHGKSTLKVEPLKSMSKSVSGGSRMYSHLRNTPAWLLQPLVVLVWEQDT